jgi:hypothetical protein
MSVNKQVKGLPNAYRLTKVMAFSSSSPTAVIPFQSFRSLRSMAWMLKFWMMGLELKVNVLNC